MMEVEQVNEHSLARKIEINGNMNFYCNNIGRHYEGPEDRRRRTSASTSSYTKGKKETEIMAIKFHVVHPMTSTRWTARRG